jgi:hypothetical protein
MWVFIKAAMANSTASTRFARISNVSSNGTRQKEVGIAPVTERDILLPVKS